MIVGGVVAGQGEISLFVLISIVWACAVAGDVTSYTVGRKLGRAWLLRHGERLKITEDRLEQVERFFEKRGGATILIGRFIGFVRALAPFIAGTSRMPLRRFLPYDVLGAGAWAATFATLGYVFWHSFDRLTTYVSRGLFAFSTVVVVVAAFVALVQLRRDPEKRRRVREWLEAAARPARLAHGHPRRRAGVAADRPPARRRSPTSPPASASDRLTPGGLGLELTTLLALFAVGAYSFFFIGDIASAAGRAADRRAGGRPRARAGDGPGDRARQGRDRARLVPVVALAALATVAWTLLRRRWIEAATLTAGVALSPLLVGMAKAAYDRARPEGGLVDVRRRRLSVGPHRLLGRARRLRRRARPRRRGLGGALRGRHRGRRRWSWWSA